MAARELKPGVHAVGVLDWDKKLFDDLIPLPEGTSYQSYVVKGAEKTALIDAVDPAFESEFMANLSAAGVTKLDYLIANHAEQDHSGCLPAVLARFPEAKVVANAKCSEYLQCHLHIPSDRCTVVADGATLDLGGRTLQFVFAPWVHWPETMFTHLREDKILFTCDFLGSHRATTDLFATDEHATYLAAKRYYAEIMAPYRTKLGAYLDKVEALAPDMVAPSHGPIHNRPRFIIDAHREWIADKPKNLALVAYVSMHGSTKMLVDRLVNALMAAGVGVQRINLADMDLGDLAMGLVDAATLVLGSSTVLTGPHPAAVSATYLLNALRPKARFATFLNSYAWGGKTTDILKGMMNAVKAEYLDAVQVKGMPTEEDLKAVDRLAATIAAKHASL